MLPTPSNCQSEWLSRNDKSYPNTQEVIRETTRGLNDVPFERSICESPLQNGTQFIFQALRQFFSRSSIFLQLPLLLQTIILNLTQSLIDYLPFQRTVTIIVLKY